MTITNRPTCHKTEY